MAWSGDEKNGIYRPFWTIFHGNMYKKQFSTTEYPKTIILKQIKAHNHLFWPNFKYVNLYYH